MVTLRKKNSEVKCIKLFDVNLMLDLLTLTSQFDVSQIDVNNDLLV